VPPSERYRKRRNVFLSSLLTSRRRQRLREKLLRIPDPAFPLTHSLLFPNTLSRHVSSNLTLLKRNGTSHSSSSSHLSERNSGYNQSHMLGSWSSFQRRTPHRKSDKGITITRYPPFLPKNPPLNSKSLLHITTALSQPSERQEKAGSLFCKRHISYPRHLRNDEDEGYIQTPSFLVK